MRKSLLVAVLVLAACGKKASTPPKGDCAASINHAIDLSKDDYKKSNVSDDVIPKIREASLKRCQEDKWSDDVLKCFMDAKSVEDVTKCQKKMTKEQFENMGKAVSAVMQAQPDTGSGSGSDPGGSAGSGSSADTGSGSAVAVAVTVGLPPECADYKSMLDKVLQCDKLPQPTRDAMKKSFDLVEKSFANIKTLPEASQKTVIDGCKLAADGMKKAAGGACGL